MSWLRLRHILKRVKIKSRETQTYKALSGGGFLRGRGDFACSSETTNPLSQIQTPPP